MFANVLSKRKATLPVLGVLLTALVVLIAAQAATAGSGIYSSAVSPIATLTIAKETTPSGGTGFPFTIAPGTTGDYSYAFQWGDTRQRQ